MNPPSHYPNIILKNGRFPIVSSFSLPRSIVVVTAGPGNCLLLFRAPEWEPIREKLLNYPVQDDPTGQAKVSMLRRLLLGNARDVRISGHGKIGLDDDLMEFAQIQGRLLWVPGHKGIELWSPAIFEPSKRINLFGTTDT
jgi:MraZ protein